MLERLATVEITANLDTFDKTLMANKIATSVHAQIIEKYPDSQILKQQIESNEEKTSEMTMAEKVLRSPGICAVANSFFLSEYIKNVSDIAKKMETNSVEKNASNTVKLNLEIFAKIEADGSVMTIVRDNGLGFSKEFLPHPPGQLVDYYKTKLIGKHGEELSKVVSSKSHSETGVLKQDKGIKGGAGLGIATLARVCNTAKGSVEIGNVNDLPNDIKRVVTGNSTENEHGAVILIKAKPYTENQLQLFDKLEGMVQVYPNYVSGLRDNLREILNIEETPDYLINNDTSDESIINDLSKLNIETSPSEEAPPFTLKKFNLTLAFEDDDLSSPNDENINSIDPEQPLDTSIEVIPLAQDLSIEMEKYGPNDPNFSIDSDVDLINQHNDQINNDQVNLASKLRG